MSDDFGVGLILGVFVTSLVMIVLLVPEVSDLEMLEKIRPCGKEISGATVEVGQQKYVCTFEKWRRL